MAQQQARDEAGNIWNIDEAGNPVSLASPAPQQGGGSVVAPNPVQAQRQGVELGGAQLSNQRTAQQIAMDAVKIQSAPQMTAEELRAIQLDNAKKEKELANPAESKQTQTDRLSRLRQLAGQINRTQSLYNTGIGKTKGIAGIKDWIPTDANERFDVSGNQLSQQGLAAFKVPGMGTVSDRDAVMFDRANLPTARTRDVAVDEQLRGIRARVDEEMKALGQKPVNWQASIDSDPLAAQQQPQGAMIPGAGTTPPQSPQGPAGYDVGSVSGGPSGGSGGGGSNFASAAGVAMAKKLSQAYTRGAGVQELNRLLSDNGFQTFSDPGTIEAIQKRGRLNFAPPVADDTRGGLGKWLGDNVNGAAGAYGLSALDGASFGTIDNIAGGQTKLAQEYAASQFPTASMLGTVTGGAIGAGATELGLGALGARAGIAALAPRAVDGVMKAAPAVARGGDALYGAAYGAGSADGPDQSRLLGAALGGTGGLVGGMAGRQAFRTGAGIVGGIRNADVQLLRQKGVPMSVGQSLSQSGPLGAAIKTAEDLTTSIPGAGSVTAAGRDNSLRGFNRAMMNDSVAPLRQQTNPLDVSINGIGADGVEAVRSARAMGYDNAVAGRSAMEDPQYLADYNQSLGTAAAIPNTGPMIQSEIDAAVPGYFNNGVMSGENAQAAIRELKGLRRAREEDPLGYRTGQAVRGAENAITGMFDRQAPGFSNDLAQANAVQTNLKTIEDAVGRAVNQDGVVTPAQLNMASRKSANFLTGDGATRNRPFYDLATAAQKILPSKTADSGTSQRLAMQGAVGTLGLGAAGGTGYAGGGKEGAQTGVARALALAGLLAAGGTRPAQRLLTAGLLDRPEMLIRAGNGIANRARIGGLFGAPMLAAQANYLGSPQ